MNLILALGVTEELELRTKDGIINRVAHWGCQTKLSRALWVPDQLELRTGGPVQLDTSTGVTEQIDFRTKDARTNWLARWWCQTNLSWTLEMPDQIELRTVGAKQTWVAHCGPRSTWYKNWVLQDNLIYALRMPEQIELRAGVPDQLESRIGAQINLIRALRVTKRLELRTKDAKTTWVAHRGARRTCIAQWGCQTNLSCALGAQTI